MNDRVSIRSPLGAISVGGVGAIRASDLSLSGSADEIRARSGCDRTYWYRDSDLLDMTGSFTVQDLTAEIEAKVNGAELLTGQLDIKDRQVITAAADQLALAGAVKTDLDGKMLGSVYKAVADGEQIFEQIAPSTAPSAGQFSVNASGTELDLNSADTGDFFVTYAFTATPPNAGKLVRFKSTDTPPYVSLFLPFCSVPLQAQSVKRPVAVYIPRARITGRDFSAASGGQDFAGITYNFGVAPDSSDVIAELIFPKAAA